MASVAVAEMFEKAIRDELGKPEGELAKSDLEELDLSDQSRGETGRRL